MAGCKGVSREGYALMWNNLSLGELIHHEIYTFLSSEDKNRWEKTKWETAAAPTAIRATQLTVLNLDIPSQTKVT